MKVIEVVRISVKVRGKAKRYPYHELRIVEHDHDGGYYANSKGSTILMRSGPKRGLKRLWAEYDRICEQLIKERAS